MINVAGAVGEIAYEKGREGQPLLEIERIVR
jgi:hypothetical protein